MTRGFFYPPKMSCLAPYPDLTELFERSSQAAKALGAQVITYGQSHEQRPLIAYKIPARRADADKNVLLGANLHGVEVIGAYLALRAMESIQRGQSPAFDALLAKANLWVIPSYNPDGYQATFAAQGQGTLAKLRCNARGVDLNRNFPRPSPKAPGTFGFAGSKHPGKATYKGPWALSEPESRALHQWLAATPVHAALNLHSFSGGLIPARVRASQDFSRYKALHRAYLAGGPGPYFFRLHSRLIDAWTGELEDMQHHLLGTWAVCVELMTIKEMLAQRAETDRLFWRFNPRDPELHAQRELPRIAAALQKACDFPTPQERVNASEVWDLRSNHGRRVGAG